MIPNASLQLCICMYRQVTNKICYFRHQYLTNYQLRLSDQVPGMLSGPQPPMNRRYY